ncbi:ATP-dependent Clp protease adaptor ClpS [Tuwongella immobilis]|uniref:ATP-dependent Clp protease adapter protein ClpS n=1 Tax=Tuwongella immobilis TaxID=692036 RepID=A0A6C2YN50_9BACT|nr:ATP-dependent Clp protease adaptor ClpS [Tuwongella immobilis]VIP03038.1 atp-dependent clp protease adaptor protein : Uncharacterized protein OS=Rubrobacter radiotolerans GN=RradSPS_1834 PE=4 SV=1: ClpS [Tuwongella immobilis]VTS03202.1 atp-dependent clp protease adaptor protein : Uncharacterized protein OS=Rubrobacter radiotolerans GN=RradSPS_1834 PE=4 SV=1: ClpS [Tuwongella immobilis]
MSNPVTLPEQETDTQQKTRFAPRYHVVLLNDDDHSFEYVIFMMKKLFNHSEVRGFEIAQTVHLKGRAIVWTGALEVAELKRDQIHDFGPDPLIPRCKGSMSAELEPAE